MMKLYFLDRLVTLGFLSIGLVFTIVFLVMLNIPIVTVMSVVIVYVLLSIGWVVTSFMLLKKRLERVHHLLAEMEQPYLVGEVLPKPTSIAEQQYYEVMRAVSLDAISMVEQANRASREYKEFVEQWIHELKTPLTGMSLILANDADPRKLRRELKRLDNLTDQVLHFARLQSMEKDKQFVVFEMEPLLNQAVKNQMDLLIAAKMNVAIEGDMTVYNDQKALQFIVNQFLINSAKYCRNSQVKLTMEGQTLTYEDHGIGIPKHELPRIFDRGYTGTNGRLHGTSTGMGLYIVANMCKELHIQLEVESEVGQFTRFRLSFPQNLTEM